MAPNNFDAVFTSIRSRASPRTFGVGVLCALLFCCQYALAIPTDTDLRSNNRAFLGLSECLPSGKGRDYPVGTLPGQIRELHLVPWERLGAGDTVRIFARPLPYRGKIYVAGQGGADAPIRVCGVSGLDGKRPVVEGVNATTRRELKYGHPLHESRSVVLINRFADQPWASKPSHLQIDGLEIRGAHPSNQFVDSRGESVRYTEFGACIWIERGHHVSILDNEITDCSQAIFSKSTDDGEFAITKGITIAGNYFHGNGVAGSDRVHTTYLQSSGVTVAFNRYGALKMGARGNSIKDRSVGAVIRYNRIEDGARALDLVEAEDFPKTATQDSAYRNTYVYGNQIIKDGRKGSVIHYGGDHHGSQLGAHWGEPNFRKGTLHFFHNTVRVTGDGYAALFQLSTTEERAEVWNNIFVFDPTVPSPTLRASSEVGSQWQPGGVLSLGKNWISAGWRDGARGVKLAQGLIGKENLVVGSKPPIDPVSLIPITPRGEPLEAQSAPVVTLPDHPVKFQLLNSGMIARRLQGAKTSIGAIEAQ